jgi:hypothetical protein
MIEETIRKIEAKLQESDVKGESKAELIQLLGQLKSEMKNVESAEGAQSVVGFTELSMHEATRREKHPELLELSLKGLSRSVEEFENTHPRLVEAVNRICTTLAGMGI